MKDSLQPCIAMHRSAAYRVFTEPIKRTASTTFDQWLARVVDRDAEQWRRDERIRARFRERYVDRPPCKYSSKLLVCSAAGRKTKNSTGGQARTGAEESREEDIKNVVLQTAGLSQ